MFTGIVTDIGTVTALEQRGDTHITIATAYDVDDIDLGASISCEGACLTVVAKGRDEAGKGWFAVDASAETLRCTNLGDWKQGTPINLERALKVGDELGGHIVSGHVDAVGTISAKTDEGQSIRYDFDVPKSILPFLAPKGSVTLNGVSLTVNEVSDAGFCVNIIPHTQSVTTFGNAKVGDRINVEVDVLARYVARLQQTV